MHFPIKQWPVDERPRERVRALGVRALSTRELLALLIETGQAPRNGLPGRSALELAGDLLAAFPGEDGGESLRRLMAAPVCVVAGSVRGVGQAKATRVLAALELGRRAAEEARPERIRLATGRDVYERYRFRMRDLQHEEFYVLVLNTQNELLNETLVSRGTLDESLVHAREVFRHALHHSAASVVLMHNHPSGEPTPSGADRQITADLVKAGEILGVPVADHVIIGESRYWSFQERGELYRGVPTLQALAA
ncbi:MAG TPA: DNA repair protein RadC [Longimicrobium sp.]